MGVVLLTELEDNSNEQSKFQPCSCLLAYKAEINNYDRQSIFHEDIFHGPDYLYSNLSPIPWRETYRRIFR